LVADLSRPAFLQPPIPRSDLQGYEPLAHEPDGIDVLVTAKAHDVKPRRVGAAEAHHWLYALATLQTMQGYSGKLNYGIARMNGGFASRPLVELTLNRRWGQRFRRALRIACEARDGILKEYPDYYHGKLALPWVEPWDAEASLSLRDLDPFFVEICRRVRLVQGADGRVAAWGRNSTVPRVAAKEACGNLGDPWLPVSKDGKALTVGTGGFHYGLVVELLDSSRYKPVPGLHILNDDPSAGLWLHLAVLARGQGETGGLHERWLPLPGRTADGSLRRMLASPRLGEISRLLVDDAKNARGALRAALAVYLQGGPEQPNWRDERTRDTAAALDRRIDQELFFQHFWVLVALAGDDAAYETRLKEWRAKLYSLTRGEFEAAVEALPAPQNRKERARAKAELALGGLLRKHGLSEPRREEVVV
jgi:CRISPR system Cascade subunit CasA